MGLDRDVDTSFSLAPFPWKDPHGGSQVLPVSSVSSGIGRNSLQTLIILCYHAQKGSFTC